MTTDCCIFFNLTKIQVRRIDEQMMCQLDNMMEGQQEAGEMTSTVLAEQANYRMVQAQLKYYLRAVGGWLKCRANCKKTSERYNYIQNRLNKARYAVHNLNESLAQPHWDKHKLNEKLIKTNPRLAYRQGLLSEDPDFQG
jgi:hypothetical protein